MTTLNCATRRLYRKHLRGAGFHLCFIRAISLKESDMKLYVVLLSALLALGFGANAIAADKNPFTQPCRADDGCTIPYVHWEVE